MQEIRQATRDVEKCLPHEGHCDETAGQCRPYLAMTDGPAIDHDFATMMAKYSFVGASTPHYHYFPAGKALIYQHDDYIDDSAGRRGDESKKGRRCAILLSAIALDESDIWRAMFSRTTSRRDGGGDGLSRLTTSAARLAPPSRQIAHAGLNATMLKLYAGNAAPIHARLRHARLRLGTWPRKPAMPLRRHFAAARDKRA